MDQVKKAGTRLIKTLDVYLKDNDKRKYSMDRARPDLQVVDQQTGFVDLGKPKGGLHVGFAIRQADGRFLFTPVRRVTFSNDNTSDQASGG